jgi:hypothetical protein
VFITGAGVSELCVLDTILLTMNPCHLSVPLTKHYHTIFSDGTDLYVTDKQSIHKYQANGSHISSTEIISLKEVCGSTVYYQNTVLFVPDGTNSIYGAVLGENAVQVFHENVFN